MNQIKVLRHVNAYLIEKFWILLISIKVDYQDNTLLLTMMITNYNLMTNNHLFLILS